MGGGERPDKISVCVYIFGVETDSAEIEGNVGSNRNIGLRERQVEGERAIKNEIDR